MCTVECVCNNKIELRGNSIVIAFVFCHLKNRDKTGLALVVIS